MKTTISLILALLFATLSFSQTCPYLGPDQYLPCGVGSTTLTADLSQCGPGGANPNQTTNYNVANIPYVAQTNTGTSITMSDDSQQGPFPIGFNFCFYGITYTQFYIGSNGWISFSAAQPTTFTSQALPTANALVPKNCIMGPWQDWHPGLGGQIRYQTTGVAPCRKLTVSWIGVPMFSCTSNIGTFHIVLYESTNNIENYIQSKPACLSWQGGTAVEGIHNLAGNAAVIVPGRNSTAWTANNDAWRWTPSGPAVTPVLTWYQVGNPVAIGTGPTITVTPPPAGANYTCHFVYPTCNAGWSTCNAIAGNGPDTVFVQPGPPNLPNPLISFTDPVCAGDCNGSITVVPQGGNGVSTISWTGPATTFNPTGLCAGSYNYTITDALACSVSGVVTLTDPAPVTVSPITGSDTVCFGSTLELYSVINQVGYTYTWNTLGGITSPQGGNTVTVDWSTTPAGVYNSSVEVTAYNASNCASFPEYFNIVIFNIEPTIEPIGPFCSTDACVTLSASPAGGVFVLDGNIVSQFCPQTATSTSTISYTYSQSGCVFTEYSTVTVSPQPYITNVLPSNTFVELCEGDSVSIVYSVESTLPGTVEWYVNGDTLSGLSLGTTWQTFGAYTITAVLTTPQGCVSPPADANITIEECPQVLIFIPNAFTPDGDETNNYWLPVFTSGFDPYEYTVYIYNRWGEIVWESHNHTAHWDGTYNGTLCTEGVYTYMITYGNPDDDGRNTLHGHLTLVR